MRSQQFFHALFVLVLLTAGVFAQSGAGDKERNKERLIKVTQFLEQDPFDENAKDFRAWAVKYVIETDDVSVTICGGPLIAPIMDKKYKYSSEMLTQYTIAMASFKLQNPDNKDENAAQLAGLESVVKAYRAILRTKPKTATAGMDALSADLDSGQLKKAVEAADCGSGKAAPGK